jgi:hypothetical protein
MSAPRRFVGPRSNAFGEVTVPAAPPVGAWPENGSLRVEHGPDGRVWINWKSANGIDRAAIPLDPVFARVLAGDLRAAAGRI